MFCNFIIGALIWFISQYVFKTKSQFIHKNHTLIFKQIYKIPLVITKKSSFFVHIMLSKCSILFLHFYVNAIVFIKIYIASSNIHTMYIMSNNLLIIFLNNNS